MPVTRRAVAAVTFSPFRSHRRIRFLLAQTHWTYATADCIVSGNMYRTAGGGVGKKDTDSPKPDCGTRGSIGGRGDSTDACRGQHDR